MSNPRVEEVSDSDPEIDDPSTFLPDSDNSIIVPANIPSTVSARNDTVPTSGLSQPRPPQSAVPNLNQQPSLSQQQSTAAMREKIKTYCTLYPLYFDSTRTRAEGRRVSKSQAIPNPLAYNLLTAVRDSLGNNSPLHLAFEPDKTHPKDWSNPGRVRIQLFSPDTHSPLHPTIKCKAHLYSVVGKFLQSHQTEKQDPLLLKIQGLPVPKEFEKTEIAVPRGWKMGKILPVHSPAVSGGGVSDNFFKDAMEEMKAAKEAGVSLPGMDGAGGGGGMPDMAALQNMMAGMGGMGGMGNMLGGGGGGGGGGAGGSGGGGGKKKDKKK